MILESDDIRTNGQRTFFGDAQPRPYVVAERQRNLDRLSQEIDGGGNPHALEHDGDYVGI